MRRVSGSFLLAFPLLVTASSLGRAEIWNRTRTDGTVEFTNHPLAVPLARARADSNKKIGGIAATGKTGASNGDLGWNRTVEPGPLGGGTFWARERPDGVVEFTNLRPAGKNWKVWLKTGPGKAASLRGPTDVVPPRDVSPSRYSRYDQDIRDQQLYYGIPEALIRAVMKVESDFDPHVVSSVGAQGLMQLMPDTARLMGVTDSFDSRQNIMGGARYLQVLARRFCRTPSEREDDTLAIDRPLVCSDDERTKVIAGYHAGPAAVERYGGMPPYETTRAYVTMVLRRYDEYRRGPAAHDGAFVPER
jgi:hypothetical protein